MVEVLPPCGSDPGMSSCNLAIALVEVDGDAPANQDVVQNLDVCTLYRPPLGIPVSCWGSVHLLRARGLLCIGPPVMSWAVHGVAVAPWLHVRCPARATQQSLFCLRTQSPPTPPSPRSFPPALQDGEFITVGLVPMLGLRQYLLVSVGSIPSLHVPWCGAGSSAAVQVLVLMHSTSTAP